MTRRSRGKGSAAALLSLIIVAIVTFLQNVIDLLQSYSLGAYMPTWQRVLIIIVLVLSFIGVIFAYRGGGGKRVFKR